MKTTGEVQKYILDNTGIKTSVKKCKGSMKDYYAFTPMFQGGVYPNFPFEFTQGIKKLFPVTIPETIFSTIGQIHLHTSAITDERTKYKKECKPVVGGGRTWGSKNSQMRLDKAAARYAKRARKGNTVRYW